MCTYAYYSIFHPSLSLSLSIFLSSFISFIKKQFARSLLFFYLLQISPSLRAWKSSRSPCLFGPAPQNVITASRSAFVRSPSIFLHSSFIFFSFFFSFSSQSRHPHIRIPRTGIARALLSVNCFVGTGNPFRSVQSLEPAIFFISLPFSLLSDSFHRGKSRSARSNDRTLARERIHDLDRSSGGKRREGRGFRLRFFFFFFFFSPPSLCFSSSKFFLFSFPFLWVFAIRLRDPWRFVLRAWTPRSSIDGERNR